MTKPNEGQTRRGWTWQRALAFLACLIVSPALANARDGNTIDSIKTVKAGVDIELTSTKEFPVRDELVVLRIGTKEFTKSRSPDDGNLNTLIFTLTTQEFDQVATGDEVTVQYGRDGSSERWDFGKLDKRLRDK